MGLHQKTRWHRSSQELLEHHDLCPHRSQHGLQPAHHRHCKYSCVWHCHLWNSQSEPLAWHLFFSTQLQLLILKIPCVQWWKIDPLVLWGQHLGPADRAHRWRAVSWDSSHWIQIAMQMFAKALQNHHCHERKQGVASWRIERA